MGLRLPVGSQSGGGGDICGLPDVLITIFYVKVKLRKSGFEIFKSIFQIEQSFKSGKPPRRHEKNMATGELLGGRRWLYPTKQYI